MRTIKLFKYFSIFAFLKYLVVICGTKETYIYANLQINKQKYINKSRTATRRNENTLQIKHLKMLTY